MRHFSVKVKFVLFYIIIKVKVCLVTFIAEGLCNLLQLTCAQHAFVLVAFGWWFFVLAQIRSICDGPSFIHQSLSVDDYPTTIF